MWKPIPKNVNIWESYLKENSNLNSNQKTEYEKKCFYQSQNLKIMV